MNDEQERFFIAAFDKAMQHFTTIWNDESSQYSTEDILSGFMLAASLFSLCEKYNFKHQNFEHAATLLNQAAVQLGLEEKF